jgi:hypothetical protein
MSIQHRPKLLNGLEPLTVHECKTTVILSGFLKITRPTGVVSSAAPTDFGADAVMRKTQGGAALEDWFGFDALDHVSRPCMGKTHHSAQSKKEQAALSRRSFPGRDVLAEIRLDPRVFFWRVSPHKIDVGS